MFALQIKDYIQAEIPLLLNMGWERLINRF